MKRGELPFRTELGDLNINISRIAQWVLMAEKQMDKHDYIEAKRYIHKIISEFDRAVAQKEIDQ